MRTSPALTSRLHAPPPTHSSPAGQDRFGALYRIYYRDAFGALLVFDLSRPETFQSVLRVRIPRRRQPHLPIPSPRLSPPTPRSTPRHAPTFFFPAQWKREIDTKVTLPNGSPLPVVLLANKCDLPDTRVDKEELDAFCKEHGFIGWYETSAKSNHNIEESVKGLVTNILSHPDAFEAHRLKTQAAAGGAGGAGAGAAGGASAVSLADDKKGKSDKGGCC